MYTNYARWFCKQATGHDRTWPAWANDECPVCKKEFTLADEIIIPGDADDVYHYGCYSGDKPDFESQVAT